MAMMEEVRALVKKNFKGRCTKRELSKCGGVARTYSDIQYAYADRLQADETIRSFECNVLLDGLEMGQYTTDFVCTRQDGDIMVRECVERRHLMKPMTVKLLDASRRYWLSHGVSDWGIVVDGADGSRPEKGADIIYEAGHGKPEGY